MTDCINDVIDYVNAIIRDAESRTAGNGSILDYGMRIRRNTAEEIRRFIEERLAFAQGAAAARAGQPAAAPVEPLAPGLGARVGMACGRAALAQSAFASPA